MLTKYTNNLKSYSERTGVSSEKCMFRAASAISGFDFEAAMFL